MKDYIERFDSLEEYQLSEEMLGAYLEHSLDPAEEMYISELINSDPELFSMYQGVESLPPDDDFDDDFEFPGDDSDEFSPFNLTPEDLEYIEKFQEELSKMPLDDLPEGPFGYPEPIIDDNSSEDSDEFDDYIDSPHDVPFSEHNYTENIDFSDDPNFSDDDFSFLDEDFESDFDL